QGRRVGRVLRALQGGARRHPRADPGRRRPPGEGHRRRRHQPARRRAARGARQEGRVAEVRLWLLLCGVALAQGTPGHAPLSYEALQKAPVGSWAEYDMMVGTQKGTTMRYALVEKSAKALAIEIETLMPPLVMRMDFSAAPSGDGWNLSRVRMRA